LVAARHGLKVLVAEKSKFIGGTTAYSGGGAWIPVNRHQAVLGIKDDSATKSDSYLRNVLGDAYEKEKIHAFLHSGPRMVEWMESNTDVQFKPVPLPDYHDTEGGASIGRTMLTKEFDGRVLGSRIKDVRYTLQGSYAFRSLQMDPSELAILTNPFGSAHNLTISISKLTRYLWDEFRYGKGTMLANGNALVGRLLFSCLKAGVEVQTNCPTLRPIQEDNGSTIGVVVRMDGEEKALTAEKGVVLASGGFGRGKEARSYVPHDWSAQPQSVVGDGIRIGREFGATLPPPNADNGIFAPISLLERSDGQIRRYPHFYLDLTKPGAVIVGPDGRRFANEAEPYQEFVKKMHKLPLQKAYLVADRSFLRKYGIGMALPWPYPVSHLIRQGYLIKSPTLEGLAERIGVPADSLRSTVRQMNDYARTGVDLDFGRGNSSYDRFNGDANSGTPNPNLGPCSKPPFYALPLHAGNVSTMYGLAVNENAQALNKAGTPIARLYAVGLDQNSIFKGHYPGGGSSIGPAMTFGYRAALHMAGVKEEL
jgi:succinate dehydrogenase/fumarate reductase flavoprotein subunit